MWHLSQGLPIAPKGPIGSIAVLVAVVQQVDPDLLAEVCGADPSFICREVLDATDSRRAAEVADILFAKPLSILVVVVLAWVLNRLARKAIDRFVHSVSGEDGTGRRLKRRLRRSRVGGRLPVSVLETGQVSIRSAARAETLGYVLRSVATFAIWAIAVLTILGELGLNLGPLIAGAGIAGVAIGFGAQSLVKDFLAGIFILTEDQYGVGDIVDVGEATGTVEAVSLRTTKLRSVDGVLWHVPNGQIARVGNMSQQWARALLDVSVAYNADLELAKATIKEVADSVWRDPAWSGRVLEEPTVWGVEALAADGVTIRLVVKTVPSAQFEVLRELRSRIKHAMDAAGIEIPYPQRTVWVRRDPGSSAESDSGDADALDA